MKKDMLYVGLHRWIIDDGNYSDFRVGDSAKFALEALPQLIEASKTSDAAFEHTGASRYRICGQVVHLHPTVWIIDCGISVFIPCARKKPLDFMKEGEWLQAEVTLGVDPYPWDEKRHSLPGMSALQREWHIKSISLETTPWLTHMDNAGRTYYRRDPQQKESFVDVTETNARHGFAQYVFECESV